jgi:hypothetical protein
VADQIGRPVKLEIKLRAATAFRTRFVLTGGLRAGRGPLQRAGARIQVQFRILRAGNWPFAFAANRPDMRALAASPPVA